MDRLIESLFLILEQSQELYQRMLMVLDQEIRAALVSDIDQMTLATTEKNDLIIRLKELESERSACLQQIAKTMQLPRTRLTITTLLEHIEPHYGARLKSLNSSLTAVLAKVRRTNNESRLLIQHCLRLVKNSICFFNHWTGLANVYCASGNFNETVRGHGRFLSNCV